MRKILHCDLNSFFASVECLLDESVRNLPVAVTGSVSDRHGVVLAKNQLAKELGIKTGMTAKLVDLAQEVDTIKTAVKTTCSSSSSIPRRTAPAHSSAKS